ncbi:putative mitochondrial protein [Cucumis melo var. makuwa]|uniref:Mitochondrial protein n=1 Tax=Cucumis melo var. makuwa TaxID=1194695 RepID=A0A5A7UAQ4_CUCMM|nr:putative mitochondrial protein [Cucumis melo var. makuwa]
MFPFKSLNAQPMFIVIVLTKLNSLLELRLLCLLGILDTNEAINTSIHLHTSTLLSWMSHLLRIILSFPLAYFKGRVSKMNSTNSHTNSKAGENNGFETVVPEDMGEQGSIDGPFKNTSKYDPSLHLPIAPRKGTRFTTFIKSQVYNQGHSDHTLFTKVSKTGKIEIRIVYVDDIVLSRDDTNEIIQLKKKMGFEFEIKDLEKLKYFLEMKIARSKKGIPMSQRKYTLDLLAQIGMLGCRPIDTTIEFNAKLKNSGDKVPIDKDKSASGLSGEEVSLSCWKVDLLISH